MGNRSFCLSSMNTFIGRVRRCYVWFMGARMWRDVTINTFWKSQLSLPNSRRICIKYPPESTLNWNGKWMLNSFSLRFYFFGENTQKKFSVQFDFESALQSPFLCHAYQLDTFCERFGILLSSRTDYWRFATCVCKFATNRWLFWMFPLVGILPLFVCGENCYDYPWNTRGVWGVESWQWWLIQRAVIIT